MLYHYFVGYKVDFGMSRNVSDIVWRAEILINIFSLVK